MASPADESFSSSSVLPGRRVLAPQSWVGFWAILAGAVIAVCAASVGTFLLLAYLAGTGAAR
jgi:hypothetical protein